MGRWLVAILGTMGTRRGCGMYHRWNCAKTPFVHPPNQWLLCFTLLHLCSWKCDFEAYPIKEWNVGWKLDQTQPCDLLWPIQCVVKEMEVSSGYKLQRSCSFHLAPNPWDFLDQPSLLEDERALRGEMTCPS